MAKRVDNNQAEIVAGLRRYGATVLDVHTVPGCFDILVGFRGRDYKMEVKSEKGWLTKAETEFHKAWRGAPVYIVHDVYEAIYILATDMEDE